MNRKMCLVCLPRFLSIYLGHRYFDNYRVANPNLMIELINFGPFIIFMVIQLVGLSMLDPQNHSHV